MSSAPLPALAATVTRSPLSLRRQAPGTKHRKVCKDSAIPLSCSLHAPKISSALGILLSCRLQALVICSALAIFLSCRRQALRICCALTVPPPPHPPRVLQKRGIHPLLHPSARLCMQRHAVLLLPRRSSLCSCTMNVRTLRQRTHASLSPPSALVHQAVRHSRSRPLLQLLVVQPEQLSVCARPSQAGRWAVQR